MAGPTILEAGGAFWRAQKVDTFGDDDTLFNLFGGMTISKRCCSYTIFFLWRYIFYISTFPVDMQDMGILSLHGILPGVNRRNI